MTTDKTLQDQAAAGDTTMGLPPKNVDVSGPSDWPINEARRYAQGYADARKDLAGDPVPRSPVLTPEQIEAAAKKLAELTDYPWTHMPKEGRIHMRQNAEAVIRAAFSE